MLSIDNACRNEVARQHHSMWSSSAPERKELWLDAKLDTLPHSPTWFVHLRTHIKYNVHLSDYAFEIRCGDMNPDGQPDGEFSALKRKQFKVAPAWHCKALQVPPYRH